MNHSDNNIDEESVIGFDALYESMHKCVKGVLWKGSVSSFFLNGIERTINLEKALKEGTYKAYPPSQFKVTYPKERDILSIAFRDRVYQRSLNDNAIYPCMTRGFIRDNCACQRGKGTDDARNRLVCFLQKCHRQGGKWCVLQCDIHGYYPNMTHSVAKETFRRSLGVCIYNRTERVLDEQYAGEVGFNPGSQMVQIAGISVLNPLDHFIKEKLHIKYYIRYMDDFILIHRDRKYLVYCKEQIQMKLNEMGFEFNPKKSRIYPLQTGIMFLGFKFILTDSGKVLRILNPENIRHERKKLYRLVKRAMKGEMTKAKVDDCYAGWRNHAEHGNSFKLLQRMDNYYKDLWKGAKCYEIQVSENQCC